MQTNVTIGIAFFAGLASFLSPCVFPLVPAYIGYLSGRSVAAGSEQKNGTLLTLSHGFAFVIGFSVVFVLFGALAGAVGGLLDQVTEILVKVILVKVGGIIVIIFGLHMTKIVQIPFLNYDLRPQSRPDRQRGYLSSALMGVFFSAGWAPCVGPVLGAILTLSFNQGLTGQGALLLSAYSAGLALPFLIAATQIGWVTTIIRRYGKVMHWAEIIMGLVLIVIGVLLLLGRFELLASFSAFFDIFDEVAVGRLFLTALLASLLFGLIPGIIAKSKGKVFIDNWFLGAGLFLVILIILFFLGILNPLLVY
jgi:cytochrome c-type biogenesis protein